MGITYALWPEMRVTNAGSAVIGADKKKAGEYPGQKVRG
jgi:hypothetical protein